MNFVSQQIYSKIIEEVNKKKISIVINPNMLASERKNPIEKNYEILEVIGKGGFGEVKKIRHRDLNVIRALKVI
jgi:hypothetical protein